VELLVVVSIMASLFGLIVVGMRPSVGGELRRAAQQFASVLLAAQSRGIGDPKGVAITVTNGGDLQQGYRVQFFGSDPDSVLPASAWFGFQPPGTVSLRAGDGQSIANTAWPTPVGGQLRARVACYPAKGPLAVAFPKTVGIDLRYSGTGDDPATAWGGLASKGDLAVSFDSVGTLDALMRGVGSSTAASRQPVEPVYFLVAARADIEGDTALASDRSLWVAIQPQTGRVTTSANVPQSGKDRVAVRAARANARAALATGK
jgi:type II secretory pathway pseudopilin PulG